MLDGLTAQTGAQKKKSDARVGSAAERTRLTLQLSHNARQLGLTFAEHPTEATTYFDKKYFNQHHASPDKSGPAAPPAH